MLLFSRNAAYYRSYLCLLYTSYPKAEKYALKNVNITLNAGERLAVVGLNGAGKSTFIKLLLRLYEMCIRDRSEAFTFCESLLLLYKPANLKCRNSAYADNTADYIERLCAFLTDKTDKEKRYHYHRLYE